MEIEYSDALLAYMKKRKKNHVVIDVATSDTSDFEVAEIFLRLASDKELPYLKEKKRFRSAVTGVGEVLLPPYRLHVGERIRLDVKNWILFHNITVEGIEL